MSAKEVGMDRGTSWGKKDPDLEGRGGVDDEADVETAARAWNNGDVAEEGWRRGEE